MDNTIARFEEIRRLATALPVRLQLQLIEVLQGSVADASADKVEEDQASLTHEEIAELIQPTPMTGKEIVEGGYTGGWKDKEDLQGKTSVEWVREQRSGQRYQW